LAWGRSVDHVTAVEAEKRVSSPGIGFGKKRLFSDPAGSTPFEGVRKGGRAGRGGWTSRAGCSNAVTRVLCPAGAGSRKGEIFVKIALEVWLVFARRHGNVAGSQRVRFGGEHPNAPRAAGLCCRHAAQRSCPRCPVFPGAEAFS